MKTVGMGCCPPRHPGCLPARCRSSCKHLGATGWPAGSSWHCSEVVLAQTAVWPEPSTTLHIDYGPGLFAEHYSSQKVSWSFSAPSMLLNIQISMETSHHPRQDFPAQKTVPSTLATASRTFLTSGLNYCSSLYLGMEPSRLRKLPLVQNVAACVLRRLGAVIHQPAAPASLPIFPTNAESLQDSSPGSEASHTCWDQLYPGSELLRWPCLGLEGEIMAEDSPY